MIIFYTIIKIVTSKHVIKIVLISNLQYETGCENTSPVTVVVNVYYSDVAQTQYAFS